MCGDWDLWENKTYFRVCLWGHPHPAAQDWHREGQRERFGISCELGGFLLPHPFPHHNGASPAEIYLGKDKKWDHCTVKGERERWKLHSGATEHQMQRLSPAWSHREPSQWIQPVLDPFLSQELHSELPVQLPGCCWCQPYPVNLPHPLLPPPALVLADEAGRGALLRGAAQPEGKDSKRHPWEALAPAGADSCSSRTGEITHTAQQEIPAQGQQGSDEYFNYCLI